MQELCGTKLQIRKTFLPARNKHSPLETNQTTTTRLKMADLVRIRLLTLRAAINNQLQQGNKLLAESDPEIFALIQKEKKRQIEGLELIASEVSFRPS